MSRQGDHRRTLAAGQTAVRLLKAGVASGRLQLASRQEQVCLDRIERELAGMPASE